MRHICRIIIYKQRASSLYVRMKIAYLASGSIQCEKCFPYMSPQMEMMLYLNRCTKAAEPAISFFILYDYSHSCWNGIHLQIPFFLSFFFGSFFFLLNEIFFNKEGSRKQFNILIHIYLFGVRFSFSVS